MLNVLVIDRYRYNSLRHNPMELIWLLHLFAVLEEDGSYTIKKNRETCHTGNVSADVFEMILTFYK
jgi:hypothetical protein